MKTMYIRYDGWSPSVLGDAVSGQVNTLRCSFAFSADWDAYKNRKAIFETDEAKKEESLDENGVCLIPRAVLMKRGKLKISAYGTETGENGELLRYNGRPAEIIVDLGGNVEGEITDDPVYPQIGEAVLYTAQSLTEAQQAQARANIGAGTPYTLPEASPDALGGVKADAAETADTQPVRKGTDGKLYTAPGGDTSIGITGASAGQIPKVKAVDESGAPTEWKAEKDTTPFIVTVGGTASSGYTSSHTFEEIVAAANAGRVVMGYTEYMYIPGVSASDLFGVYFNLYSTQDVAAFEYTDSQKMIRYGFYVSPVGISASAAYISAKSYDFGGVKADSAESSDTQPVRIGEDGKLYTSPGGGMEKYTLLSSVDSIAEAVQSIEFTELNGCNDFILTMLAPKSTARSGILIYLNNRQVNSFAGTYWMHQGVSRDIVVKLNCALPDDHYECRGMACQANSIAGQDAVPGTIFGTTFLAGAELTSVKFAVANSDSQIPAGTSYKLYGRKIHVV